MALRKSGIQLIVGNFQGFMANMGKVNKAYQNTGKAADKASTRIQSLGVRVANAASLQANAMRRVEMATIRLARAQDLHLARTAAARNAIPAVSYTHLTLPTILLV